MRVTCRDGIQVFRGDGFRVVVAILFWCERASLARASRASFRFLFGPGKQVAVPVECEAHRRVPGPGGDLLRIASGGDPEGYRGMAEIMRPEMNEPCLLHGRHPESLSPQVELDRATVGCGEHQVLGSPARRS